MRGSNAIATDTVILIQGCSLNEISDSQAKLCFFQPNHINWNSKQNEGHSHSTTCYVVLIQAFEDLWVGNTDFLLCVVAQRQTFFLLFAYRPVNLFHPPTDV